MLQLPRWRAGDTLGAGDLNRLCDAIERAFNITVVGAAQVVSGPTGITIVLAPTAVSATPLLLAYTVGRHDLGVTQAVTLYSEVAQTGDITEELEGASEPVQVQCVNRFGNLAGNVPILITDLEGTGVLYNIVTGNPCMQGNTGGPSA
jgi:hypothetical protein